MALWKTNFPTEPKTLCATRILEAWDEPNAHVCRQEERHVHQHVQKVKEQMTSTTMLNDIIEAHQPYTSNTEENTSATIDSSFVFHAGGQEPPQPRGLIDIQQKLKNSLRLSKSPTANRAPKTVEANDLTTVKTNAQKTATLISNNLMKKRHTDPITLSADVYD
jgi:hypothetical protein